MAYDSFHKIAGIVWVTSWSCLLVYYIVRTTYADDLLKRFAFQIFIASAVMLVIFCLSNVSSVVELESQEERMFYVSADADDRSMEFVDEASKHTPGANGQMLSAIYRNAIEFSYCHPTYSIIAALGEVCLLSSMVTAVMNLFLDSDGQDLCCASQLLMVVGVALMVSVLVVANKTGLYRRDVELLKYIPFDEIIHVPVNIVGYKLITAALTGGSMKIVQILVGLAFFLGGAYVFHFMHRRQPVEFGVPRETFSVGEAHAILVGVMVFVSVCGICMMAPVLASSYKAAKKSLLVTMERNWQRNMAAYEFILPNESLKNLQELKDLLRRKQKSLSSEEKYAFDYVSVPLWRPKRPFLEKREQDLIDEELRKEKEILKGD